MIKMDIGLHVEYPLFLSDFNETLIFSTNFRKYSYIKFHENPSRGAELFLADRREAKSRFAQFCERA